MLERARVERTLTDLVLALEEPYRTTILLRYREGLTAEAIAKRDRVPAGTVRRRLKTGVDRLRCQLDERESSKTWRAAFAPFLAMRRRRTPWRRLVMAKTMTKTGVAVIVLLLLAIGGGALVWKVRHGGSHDETAGGGHSHAQPVAVMQGSAADPVVFAQAGLGRRTLAGRVTYEAKPFASATVRIVHALTQTSVGEAKTGEDGTFAFSGLTADAFVVTASATDKTAMPLRVDLRAPNQGAVELALIGCSHVRGIVSDSSGGPIAHAHVSRDDTAWPSADTDAFGHYDLCTHYGPTTLRFTASGYQGATAALSVGAHTQRDMVLLPEAVVAGTVIGVDGEPVGDAWITIDPRDKFQVREAAVHGRSAADGSFRLDGVSPGRVEVSAIAPGARSRKIGLVLGAGETREGVVVRLDRAARFSGHIVEGDKPVAGASIGLRVGSLPEPGLAVSQADGSFSIDRAPPGELAVVVEGYRVVSPHFVKIAADTVADIVVRSLPKLRGTVVRNGAPVPNAMLDCPGAPITDANGAFTCTLDTFGRVKVIAQDGEGHWGQVEVTIQEGDSDATVTIELANAGAICGTVRDDAGAPIRGITVHAANDLMQVADDDTSGDDGAFCVRYLRNDGTYVITVASGGQNLEPTTPIPPVKIVDGHAEISIVLASPKSSIAGIVVDDAGAPLADVAVRVRAEAARPRFDDNSPLALALTDGDGHFSIEHLADGNYTVIAAARDGGDGQLAHVAAGTHDVKLTLATAGAIDGTLVGFTTTPVITGSLSGHDLVDFEVDGAHFSAHGLPPGSYKVTADTNGQDSDTAIVTVAAGKTAAVTLTSRGTATVVGTVIDWKTQAPIAGAMCHTPIPCVGHEFAAIYVDPALMVVSDAAGHFTVTGSAGEVLIACTFDGVRGNAYTTLQPDRTANVVVKIVKPAPAGSIDAHFEGSNSTFDQIEANGAAAKAGLQVGDQVIAVDGVSVTDIDGGSAMQVITQRPPGTTAALTIQRDGAVRTVTVTVHAGS
ncbi:MAG TPA: carboxypeptidase regulatory-like domain-containing protein [Kofleriaceae bacterium]|nr:carboxypeptidase regulatory-like domain-containing protein [Kofleriaceae bacterium]